MKKVLILGYGFAGRGIHEEFKKSEYDVQVLKTSRHQQDCLRFDFENEDTWKNIPKVDGCIWTFPVIDLQKLKKFLKTYLHHLNRIVIVGSTGHFETSEEDEVVTEKSSRDQSVDRVLCEDYIVSRGGILVCASGLYGQERSPLEWIRKGHVGRGRKYLNTIHRDDLGQVLVKALKKGRPGATYIASDGSPYRWSDLIAQWENHYGLTVSSEPWVSKKSSKFVDSRFSLETLGIRLKHKDVLSGVEAFSKV